MSCGTRAQGSARAILMASGSSVLPSRSVTCQAVLPYCTVACGSATPRQPARRPSFTCSGSGPRCRASRCSHLQPMPSPGCCSLISLPPGSSSLPGPAVSWLREKPYPRNRRMSTPATIDFATSGAEVICPESRGRPPPPVTTRPSLPEVARVHAAPGSAGQDDRRTGWSRTYGSLREPGGQDHRQRQGPFSISWPPRWPGAPVDAADI
jgi:hypothetical protein